MQLEVSEMNDTMALVRALEGELQELCFQGLAGDLHFSKGQEAIAVGACAALRETDYIVAHHRTIAHAVAKGVPLYPLVAELLGKKDGLNGGVAGEMHMSDPEHRFMFTFQLVGTCVPVAAGLAWAIKEHKKTNDIVAVFHGDAATSNGQWHEGMNIAAVQGVPLLLICENNGLAGNITPKYYQPDSASISWRANAYGVGAKIIDGNDIAIVRAEVAKAAHWVRTASQPFLLECRTNRLGWHKQGMPDARSKEALAKLAESDPLRDYPEDQMLAHRERVRCIIKQVQGEPALA